MGSTEKDKLANNVWQRRKRGQAHYFINGKSLCGKLKDEQLTNFDGGVFAHSEECSSCYVIRRMKLEKERI